MPKLTINGQELDYSPGQTILQVANDAGIAIPQYCYHDGLSIVASCRICLAEVWAPNPRNNNKLESMGKLLPTCQTACTEGMVVYTDSPKSIANQKAVMEYLLINHPLDCPVCDQSGECFLQDYSYEYGRSVSRFEEAKVKQPKKDLGPHVYLYSDRCIMCSRCVRFTREVTGTAELMIEGRGNQEQIDVFPGLALSNELSANVVDLCPVGALLDKDFLFAQRVWFLRSTPSIDGITASGDNIRIDHNEGKVYRVKPRTNAEINKWWISDEIRYGWKFVHSDDRLRSPQHLRSGARADCDFPRAYNEMTARLRDTVAAGKRILLVVSPMLPCEDAFQLARMALAIDPSAGFAVGPVPRQGEDKTFPGGYTVRAEKAPNARGVRRVLEALAARRAPDNTRVASYDELLSWLGGPGAAQLGGMIVVGGYPSEWVTPDFAAHAAALQRAGGYVVAIDILPNRLTQSADLVLPGATWTEKAGTFENVSGLLQSFERAIPVADGARSESQIALDLLAELTTGSIAAAPQENAAETRRMMSDPAAGGAAALRVFLTDVRHPAAEAPVETDMQIVEL
ncbi:MAG: 2Fe-2S iron-sulfur cluster-binding protein [Planctomycetota bacterium]|nr:2Fe-2S iron-sulfur cluster-binding protein [Planctomycetota bacterium]